MALYLISVTRMPPGQFPYVEPGEPTMRFPGDCDFPTQCQRILNFRKANSKPRAAYAEVAEDLSAYTCQRLGGDSRWCRDSESKSFTEATPSVAQRHTGCATCGGRAK